MVAVTYSMVAGRSSPVQTAAAPSPSHSTSAQPAVAIAASRMTRYMARTITQRAWRGVFAPAKFLLGRASACAAQRRAGAAAPRERAVRDAGRRGGPAHAARDRRRRRGRAVHHRVADLVAEDEAHPRPARVDLAGLVVDHAG